MRNRILIAIAVLAVAALDWAFWLLPTGEGEDRDSPDGLWSAHVSGLSRGALLGYRRRYVELSIERLRATTNGTTLAVPIALARNVPSGALALVTS